MDYRKFGNYCLAGTGEFPQSATEVEKPFSPLVILTHTDPLWSRSLYPIQHLGELGQESMEALLPAPQEQGPLAEFIEANGATVLNTAFPKCFETLELFRNGKKHGFVVTLVGLGDVGGTVLQGLKLLGKELSRIQIFDPNEKACRRYEIELNQVLSPDGEPLPEVTICKEEELFQCDLFLFTASRGVPPLGTGGDVRMLQFEANRAMLTHYAKLARNAQFKGLFCQISDPVDHLSRVVFLESNRNEAGELDFLGLAPEQVQGFGLGVMATRARYAAKELGLSQESVRVYGPHGAGLVAANAPDTYDDASSQAITKATREMNLRVRELGFKPYIAPGLSSAAISILRLIRGQSHFGAVPVGGVYFGCDNTMTASGPLLYRESMNPQLFDRVDEAFRDLKGFSYDR